MATIGSFEIHADDPERAARFYGGLFDRRFEEEQLLGFRYWRITGAGLPGGMLQRPIPPGAGTNAFICTVTVDDFDATAAAALAAGAVEALPKFAVPGRCWQGYFIDPEGNTFGVLEVDESAV